ncbi:MAG: flotillin family protein [Gammaproteobacteria bacterium]|nr:flotillin family protein [Gammaproteobacteria bacterium]MBU2173929.1 flotillin family protein [Gammaproteobacteria bacterium]MBU2248683.1 flotillin family protein [Gammaproteobacteria bacterium]MBU2344043.1 flotillin family protein [Gammaproteobacteria bacterium]MBU2394229.1 flotillin family protein [Gammaproteobacteria bacterium]
MLTDNLMDIVFVAGVVFAGLLLLGLILARLYKRATKEVSFVRTGFRGEKVIMNGGAIVLPVLHEIIPVNMNTLRLEVRRANEQALITRDRMRADVTAEFYVRVKPTVDSIANAAQTLGLKTMNPSELKELVEGKFVDALRSVAAEMAMEELHEKRVDFVQKVQQVVSEDLLKNGLELESVSLTGLDQTAFEHFNPQNAFDAEGLTKLTQAIESRRKIRNDIEQETDLAIKQKNLEAERAKLQISREEEYAKLEQEREVSIRRASQMSEIAREQAEKKREAEEAQIASQREVDLKRILSERDIENETIQKERAVREMEISKQRSLEQAEIERQKAIELASQDKAIAVAEKSRAESEAKALADKARAIAVKEEESVVTVRETERAERAKQVELVMARQQAEKEAIQIIVAADAEKKAAEDQAESLRVVAQGQADKDRLSAQGQADAEILLASAKERSYQVEAEGKKAINAAANMLSAEQIAMQVRLALIEQLPEIIAQSVKPMEQISDIKILQVNGLNGTSAQSGEGDSQGSASLPDQVVNSALRYRAQAPLLDSLLNEIGVKAGDINGLTAVVKDQLS